MRPGRRLHRYTYADYVAIELDSPTKHEFYDGEVYALAGGTEDHSALAAEVVRVLGNALLDKPCHTHTSDLRIYVEAAGLATFPDGSVICGPLEQHPPSPKATALNPKVLRRGHQRLLRRVRHGRQAGTLPHDSEPRRLRDRFAS